MADLGKLTIRVHVTGWSSRHEHPDMTLLTVATFPEVAEEEAQAIVNKHGTSAGQGHVNYIYTFEPLPKWLHPNREAETARPVFRKEIKVKG